jgi:hypothetical protein
MWDWLNLKIVTKWDNILVAKKISQAYVSDPTYNIKGEQTSFTKTPRRIWLEGFFKMFLQWTPKEPKI